MNWQNSLPLLIVLSAMLPGLIILRVPEQRRRLRTWLNLGGAVTCLGLIVVLIAGVYRSEVFETRLPLLPNMDLVLHADALSLLFVSLSGMLWLLTTIYAIGYLEGSPNRARFFGFFSFCVSATIGVALAGNLITFLIFYELLTLTTYPLVVHKGNPASLRAGRIYLIYTMAGGAVLLAGVAWLKALAGPLDFTATGILAGMPGLDPTQLQIIFFLLIAGLGVKAALVPLHGWLPVAMAAPAPVSALLHAVAVVKAGAFGIVRVVYDVYGIEFARDLGLTIVLAVLAASTIVYGSTRALFQNDLKKRLAYSTVSQVSYIALGTAIAGPLATIGGIVHLVHQGLMKITMFFCAGNLAETLGVHKVSELNGAGRRMPLTMAAFSLAALGMIGIPPAAGFVSKWYLGIGALEVEAYWIIGVLAISSLLNAAYFLPILYAAWFKPQTTPWPAERPRRRWETHGMLLLPPVITAALAVATGLLAASPGSPLEWVKLIAAREYGTQAVQAIQNSVLPAPQLWWVIIVPLLAAAVTRYRQLSQHALWLLPLAAMPAVAAALWSPAGINTVPWLFLGSAVGLDDTGRVFLLLAGVLWLAAGLYACDYLRADEHRARFALFFLLAMSGNFGLILAQDTFGFLTFFTLMSVASYGLVVYSGSGEARQAGKTYMQWVVAGEVMLFAAFSGLALYGGGNALNQLDPAAQPTWVTVLLLAGFGIKAGLLSLHVWLPRAHPVAPLPASALLSGIMVKAGLLGWLRFLPLGEVALETCGTVMMILGLGGALLAVVAGVVQRNPKTLLAYSTLSQMGIIAAGIGAGLLEPALWPLLLPALLLYAVHHGLAKAALFLSVDFAQQRATTRLHRLLLWIGVTLPALALAGLPMTSGAVAKVALKSSVADVSLLVTALPITAIGTSLLMLRFLDLLNQARSTTSNPTPRGVSSPAAYSTLLLLVVGMTYMLPQAQQFLTRVLSPGALWTSLWPVLLGAASLVVVRRHLDRIKPLPAGDVIVVMEAIARGGQRFFVSVTDVISRLNKQLNQYLDGRFHAGRRFAATLLSDRVDAATLPGMVFIGVLVVVLLAVAM